VEHNPDLDHHARLLAALANNKRLQIMEIISQEEIIVGDLASRVGLSQSALSQHLAKLRAGKLVNTRRDAQNIYYSSDHPGVRKILTTLAEIYGASPELAVNR
jgi:DNA-binding transcriptional ArsR family regulator